MLGHTKERHTKNIKLNLIGPANKKDKAMEALLSLGFTEVADSIPWREAFPEASDQELIGSILVGARNKAFMLEKVPEVSWDKVRGLSYAIETLKEAIEYPYHPY